MFGWWRQATDRWNRRLQIEIDQLPPGGITALPDKLWPFLWYFIRQIKSRLILIALAEGATALLISLMFWYVGELVKDGRYSAAMLWVGLAFLLARMAVNNFRNVLYHLVYTPYVGNLIRRQLYWYTARQSLAFFQNDFAGRIANKLLRSAPSLRDVIKSIIGALWWAAIFTISNVWLMAKISPWLALPLCCWLVCYILTLRHFVPKLQKYSMKSAEDMSMLTGQVVDSLTNFLPTKYFARTEYEDERVVGLLRQHSTSFRQATGTMYKMSTVIDVLNLLLMLGTAAVCFSLIESHGQIGIAATAMALPMALQANFQSGWIMYEVSGIFENLGAVQEGIEALAVPHQVVDKPGAKDLTLAQSRAGIEFKDVTFHYGQQKRVMECFSLTIPAGQKVGLVGRSGAGKSTITNLLVRAYDLESGEIRVGGQNIAEVTQDSLRKQITVVTQDSYLFHRSVLENIRYGNPDATMEEVEAAARQANAHDFIGELEDSRGRRAYLAHVGERGVKLSGGQRQRIGVARAILKNAPILLLDEATSALDSESEYAIQEALETIMQGKTVVAIAHRLSTLRQMDRIIVMEEGRIIEDGTHDELLARKDGHYAKLWRMQSGGFLPEQKA